MQILETIDTGERATRAGAWLYLDEIAHRAVNDYTAMLCMIRRASMMISDEMAGEALNDIALRLGAAATMWQALRPPSGRSSRNLDEDLAALCKALSTSVLADRQISLSLVADSIIVSSRRCWQISLVVAELVMNAARHAFELRDDGAIIVDLRSRGGILQCAVIDNGAAASIISPGRGSAIVDALVSELSGTVTRRFTGEGSTIVLHVPLIEVRSRDQLDG